MKKRRTSLSFSNLNIGACLFLLFRNLVDNLEMKKMVSHYYSIIKQLCFQNVDPDSNGSVFVLLEDLLHVESAAELRFWLLWHNRASLAIYGSLKSVYLRKLGRLGKENTSQLNDFLETLLNFPFGQGCFFFKPVFEAKLNYRGINWYFTNYHS